eukprot:TRINITY_DN3237_c0_g1_i7.p1 TRINITY_DN3237_c0_g1~~TRINITY_DN3237_c0_g1_i7.p1  ORF type:complete len:209 (+),score=47.51 TRINITY_DN3237_c0_g1_i7:38-628(+)
MSSPDKDALIQVSRALLALKSNDSFHGALERPEVRRAFNHWTGEARLPPEECEDWQSNPSTMMVLSELRRLEHCCRQASLKVPVKVVLERRDVLELPGGLLLEGGELYKVEPEKEDELEDLPARKPVDWRRQILWQVFTMVLALAMAKFSVWMQEEDITRVLAQANSTALAKSSVAEMQGHEVVPNTAAEEQNVSS